jgi:hypothetical protein
MVVYVCPGPTVIVAAPAVALRPKTTPTVARIDKYRIMSCFSFLASSCHPEAVTLSVSLGGRVEERRADE